MKTRFQGFRTRQARSLSPDKRKHHTGNMSRVVSIEIPDSQDYSSHGEGKAHPRSLVAEANSFNFSFPRRGRGLLKSNTNLEVTVDFSGDHREGTESGGVESIDVQTVSTSAASVESSKSPLKSRIFTSPLSFLGRPKRPSMDIANEIGGSSSLHGSMSEPSSSRASSASAVDRLDIVGGDDAGNSSSGRSYDHPRRGPGENLVIVAFDANTKSVPHGPITWALQNALNRGDMLALVGIIDSVPGPLGYRYSIGNQKWLAANRKLVEDDIALRKRVWSALPGLQYRCDEVGVKLLVDVKAAQRSEVAVVQEAITLDASHLVLDKSLKNRRRQYYVDNLSCDVIRMRQNGGVDLVIAGPMMKDWKCATDAPPSPTSVIPAPLSYAHQVDELETRLRPKLRITSSDSSSLVTPSSSMSSSAYNFASSAQVSSSRVGSQVRSSVSSNPNADETDDELFSIYDPSGSSTRHADLDSDLFTLNLRGANLAEGYESDDLFSIGNASTRRDSVGLAGPLVDQYVQSAIHTRARSSIDLDTSSRLRHMTSNITEQHSVFSSGSDSVLDIHSDATTSQQPGGLTEGTVTQITFLVGLGDAVEVTLCDPLRAGEALLVGSSPSALFLVHAEKHQTGFFPYRVSAGPPISYVAMEGQMAMKLADLESDQRVMVVNARGVSRTVAVGYTTIHEKPLVLVEARAPGGRRYSVMLHHYEGVCLVARAAAGDEAGGVVSVNSLKVGDRVLLRLR